MSTRVAFLRAVNLGKRRVNMNRLAEVLGGLGYENVWTYINSGNAVFDAVGSAVGSRGSVERSIESALEAEFGFEVTTFVRTAAELRRTLDKAPFEPKGNDTYFVTFLKAVPSKRQQ